MAKTQNYTKICSYGIACCKIQRNDAKILLVKRTHSYAFSDFVRAKYSVQNSNDIYTLFNNMTLTEKKCINSKNYNYVWYYFRGEFPNNDDINNSKSFYNKCKKKYKMICTQESGKFLQRVLSNTTHIENYWEIPKGRKSKSETPLETAIREFTEETKINKNIYTLLLDCPPIVYAFTDENVHYIYYYYIAIVNDIKFIPQYDCTSAELTREISDIKFMNLENIRCINTNSKGSGFYDTCKKILKIVKNH